MSTQVGKWGNSLAVRIAGPLAKRLGIQAGTEMDMEVVEGSLILRPSQQQVIRPTLSELVAGITDENRHKPTDWGGPTGREEW